MDSTDKIMENINSEAPTKQTAPHSSCVTLLNKDHNNNPYSTISPLCLEAFIQAFEDCPKLSKVTEEEVTMILKSIRNIISDSTNDWRMRRDALKKLRSLLLAGANDNDSFYNLLKPLERPLQQVLKDLRWAVAHEACITIGFLALNLRSKFDRSADFLLPSLLNLLQSSAKELSSAGRITIHLIIQSSWNSHMVTLLSSHSVLSKSREIRSSCFEFLEYVLKNWRCQYSRRQKELLEQVLKKGVAEADQKARHFARKAFEGFRDLFPVRAKKLVLSLDLCYRKALLGNACKSSSSSERTLGAMISIGTDASRRWAFITNSVIDQQAAQRAKARTEFAEWSRSMTKMISSTTFIPKQSAGSTIHIPQERPSRSRTRAPQIPKQSAGSTIHIPQERLSGSRTRAPQLPRNSIKRAVSEAMMLQSDSFEPDSQFC